jgi:hypothetical protein
MIKQNWSYGTENLLLLLGDNIALPGYLQPEVVFTVRK